VAGTAVLAALTRTAPAEKTLPRVEAETGG
jgi:hypothetical protein